MSSCISSVQPRTQFLDLCKRLRRICQGFGRICKSCVQTNQNQRQSVNVLMQPALFPYLPSHMKCFTLMRAAHVFFIRFAHNSPFVMRDRNWHLHDNYWNRSNLVSLLRTKMVWLASHAATGECWLFMQARTIERWRAILMHFFVAIRYNEIG